MPGYAVIEAPSVLGLFPRGVERLPDALLGRVSPTRSTRAARDAWELETVLATAIETGRAVGLEVTIFNPVLDADGTITRRLVAGLLKALIRA